MPDEAYAQAMLERIVSRYVSPEKLDKMLIVLPQQLAKPKKLLLQNSQLSNVNLRKKRRVWFLF